MCVRPRWEMYTSSRPRNQEMSSGTWKRHMYVSCEAASVPPNRRGTANLSVEAADSSLEVSKLRG